MSDADGVHRRVLELCLRYPDPPPPRQPLLVSFSLLSLFSFSVARLISWTRWNDPTTNENHQTDPNHTTPNHNSARNESSYQTGVSTCSTKP